ncbi:hypothetical protein MPNT_140028 [Candidatus Methylacidithermus pantelleriae]|uniref:Uncharacterized protein n=1 Tax=Candidatus Methylacidithermus pantelleriae TaxID=2744239 RepID=A0A8J2BH19_9BACT|nr:hypothetical protein MPNT_140028 [Candidatus Methylacidithermus pantelleriae]
MRREKQKALSIRANGPGIRKKRVVVRQGGNFPSQETKGARQGRWKKNKDRLAVDRFMAC